MVDARVRDRRVLRPLRDTSIRIAHLVRLGEPAGTALALITGVHALPTCEFWAEGASCIDVDLSSVRGHRQVADADLAGLARRRSAVVATLDAGFAQQHAQLTALIPAATARPLPSR